MDERLEIIEQTRQNAQSRLLNARNAHGVWEGQLSESALSTATTVIALATVAKSPRLFSECDLTAESLIGTAQGGLQWLSSNQNSDGGWGDTIKSESNISTTLLAWGAYTAVNNSQSEHKLALLLADEWIQNYIGGVDAESVSRAILTKYGKDRTFSVPILTALAIAGRLGPEDQAWRHVHPLPFELAMFPHQLYAALQLPVVSYALPALIAIGESCHVHHPTRNPLLRWLRDRCMVPARRILRDIQPESGGYLEATPLTSFVVMNLASFLTEENPVIINGLRFLLNNVGASGGWAIDTNLATWGTTLSVKALMQNNGDASIPPDECGRIKRWLLAQQYKSEHPYTHAAPGGWAWTDLSGGVPDADDTSSALLALPQLGAIDDVTRSAALLGAEWLMGLQNRDGGMPTFCRGWGALPFDQSCCDITAHALRAILTWRDAAPPTTQKRIDRFQRKALSFLQREQTEAGAWKPLWFGNENEEYNINWTYGTAVVVSSLSTAFQNDSFAVQELASDGAAWLVRAQNDTGGWGGGNSIKPSIEETALAIEALCKFYPHADEHAASRIKPSIKHGVDWLVSATQMGTQFDAAPIGFYFAELWYFEKLYPMIFTLSALNTYANLDLTDHS